MAGSVYVVSLLFLVIAVWNPQPNLQSPPFNSQVFLAYLGGAFLALSYIVGFVVHRFIKVLGDRWRFFRDQQTPKPEYEKWVEKDRKKQMKDEEAIWRLGSPRIQREADFQFAQLALLRSLMVSIPCLFISITAWRLTIAFQQ